MGRAEELAQRSKPKAFSIVLGIASIGASCPLLYNLAVYVLPVAVGLWTGFWAMETGAGRTTSASSSMAARMRSRSTPRNTGRRLSRVSVYWSAASTVTSMIGPTLVTIPPTSPPMVLVFSTSPTGVTSSSARACVMSP